MYKLLTVIAVFACCFTAAHAGANAPVIDVPQNYRVLGGTPYESFSWKIAAGDINGDSYDDIVTCDSLLASHNGVQGSSLCYVLLSNNENITADVNVSDDTYNGFSLYAGGVQDWLGNSETEPLLCDLNGDGKSEIILSTYQATTPECVISGMSNGAVYIFYGTASTATRSYDLVTMNATTGFRMYGGECGWRIGTSMNCYDVNGDGLNDLIMDGDGGTINVVYGQRDAYTNNRFSTNTLTGTKGFQILLPDEDNGIVMLPRVGRHDLNNDGVNDISVICYGSQGVFTIYGINATSRSNVNVTSMTPEIGFGMLLPSIIPRSGAVGDINNDGIDDLVISSTDYVIPGCGNSIGIAYTVYGINNAVRDDLILSAMTTDVGFNMSTFNCPTESVYIFNYIDLVDINGDDKLDFVFLGERYNITLAGGYQLYVLYGTGAVRGSFNVSTMTSADGYRVYSGSNTQDMHFYNRLYYDVNGDNVTDMIVSGLNDAKVYIILSRTNYLRSILNVDNMMSVDGYKFVGEIAENGTVACGAVIRLADINKDGDPELLVGDEFYTYGDVYRRGAMMPVNFHCPVFNYAGYTATSSSRGWGTMLSVHCANGYTGPAEQQIQCTHNMGWFPEPADCTCMFMSGN